MASSNEITTRVRILPDRVEITHRDVGRLRRRHFLISLGLFTIVLVIVGVAQRAWFAPAIFLGILVLMLHRYLPSIHGAHGIDRLVVTTAASRAHSEPDFKFPSITIPVSEVKQLVLRFRLRRDKSNDGRFELTVTVDQLGDRTLYSTGISGFGRAMRLAQALSDCWHVPLSVDARSLSNAAQRLMPRRLIGVLMIGCIPLLFSGFLAFRQLALLSWPTTEATIVDFDAGTHEPTGGLHWYANPSIRYKYEVGGVAFMSSGWNPSPFNYQSRSRFDADTAGFAPGATVTCWYNPRAPSQAYVVNRGVTEAPILLAAIAILLSALALWYWRIGRAIEAVASLR